MRPTGDFLRNLRSALPPSTVEHLDSAIGRIATAKEKGKRVAAITGSGPNIHEGVTTLIAELIRKEVVDGVITSSAVVAHEMGGTLDRVWRVAADGSMRLPVPLDVLPRGHVFEVTQLEAAQREAVAKEMPHGWDIYDALLASPGQSVIKAAGNMAWPMGLRTERLAREIQSGAAQYGVSLERFAGWGAGASVSAARAAATEVTSISATAAAAVSGGASGGSGVAAGTTAGGAMSVGATSGGAALVGAMSVVAMPPGRPGCCSSLCGGPSIDGSSGKSS